MTQAMQRVIERLSRLPEEKQERIAVTQTSEHVFDEITLLAIDQQLTSYDAAYLDLETVW